MIHGVITLLVCAMLWATPLPWPAMLLPAAGYIGREVAQAEYRYIEDHGGERKKAPWYCGFMPKAWTAKGLADCLVPLVVGIAFCVLCQFWRWPWR